MVVILAFCESNIPYYNYVIMNVLIGGNNLSDEVGL
jgi:hypothetical protein